MYTYHALTYVGTTIFASVGLDNPFITQIILGAGKFGHQRIFGPV